MTLAQHSETGSAVARPTVPPLARIAEPRVVALVQATRGGSKLFQSFLDDHPDLLMIPGYPLMYLNHHWDYWLAQPGDRPAWPRIIDLVCEKHGSILDSRRVPGLSGLERLGDGGDEHIQIDEQAFRDTALAILNDAPIERRNLMLAVHYAYGICKGWDPSDRRTLLIHAHHPAYLPSLVEDFSDLRVINMVRSPVAGLASTTRALGIVDGEKLNTTDAIVLAGRVHWRACQLEFEELHGLNRYLAGDRVVSVKLESLHRNLPDLMRTVAAWIGIPFTEGMLESTFDGKTWWGDVTNASPVSGPDPNALADKSKDSLGPKDQWVIEGITHDFHAAYGYQPKRFASDNRVRRMLLRLMIPLPTRAEWKQAANLLSPTTHLRMVRTAADEASGKIRRKNYTWNGTYLFKWTYQDLHLWRPRLHDRVLGSFGAQLDAVPRTPAPWWRRTLFVVIQYLRLWSAIVSWPRYVWRRIRIQQRRLQRRRLGTEMLPRLLG